MKFQEYFILQDIFLEIIPIKYSSQNLEGNRQQSSREKSYFKAP